MHAAVTNMVANNCVSRFPKGSAEMIFGKQSPKYFTVPERGGPHKGARAYATVSAYHSGFNVSDKGHCLKIVGRDIQAPISPHFLFI